MNEFRRKVKIKELWSPPNQNVMKFNVDGTARGKSGPAGIGGVLRDYEGSTSIVFIESVGTRDSNETEILSIRSALLT